MRKLLAFSTLAVITTVVLFAQEARQIPGGFVIVGGGNANIGTGSVIFEGATGDAFETTLSVTDPTADRIWTIPDAASDTFVGLAATQTFTNKTLTAPTITNPAVTTELVTASGGTETLTSADCGQTVLLDTAAGSVVTLPAATGTGCFYRFVVTIVLTSGTMDIVVVGNDEFIGAVMTVSTTIANSDAFFVEGGADNDTIQMDGNTEGGEVGSVLVVQDISADNWFVQGTLIAVGVTPTTPFLTGQVS